VLVYAQKDEEQGCTGERSCLSHWYQCEPGPVSHCICPRREVTNTNETPGPGFYSVTHQSAEINGTSLSKKGTAYFPSLIEKIPTPAHNHCYVSRFAREDKDGGHYDINDSLIKVSPKGITSCFKSKTSCLTRMYGFTPEPATKQPHKLTKEAKKTPFRQEFCLTLSAPAIPPCKDPPSPGPGQYNPVDYKGSPKQDCSKQTVLEVFPGPGKNKNSLCPTLWSVLYNIIFKGKIEKSVFAM
uniref:Uncharacterized protein n=1 Tax=Accipiter nisus TaxID=211598 RepID=A0A8B9MG71_9AVES